MNKKNRNTPEVHPGSHAEQTHEQTLAAQSRQKAQQCSCASATAACAVRWPEQWQRWQVQQCHWPRLGYQSDQQVPCYQWHPAPPESGLTGQSSGRSGMGLQHNRRLVSRKQGKVEKRHNREKNKISLQAAVLYMQHAYKVCTKKICHDITRIQTRHQHSMGGCGSCSWITGSEAFRD